MYSPHREWLLLLDLLDSVGKRRIHYLGLGTDSSATVACVCPGSVPKSGPTTGILEYREISSGESLIVAILCLFVVSLDIRQEKGKVHSPSGFDQWESDIDT